MSDVVNLAKSFDRLRNTPGLSRDAIAIAICVFLGVVCSVYILANQSLSAPWKEKYSFSATFDLAPGVSPSALQEVRIAGVPVGRISDADPDDGGNAKLTMTIDPDQTVYKDARLVLTTKAPLNVMYVTLDPGSSSAGELPSGESLPITQTRRATQPYEVLDNLDAKTRTALTSLLDESDVVFAEAGEDLPGSLDATGDAMTSFRPVLDQLAERRENLSSLVHSMSVISKTVGEDDERLSTLTSSANQTLETLADRDDKLAESLETLPGFTEDLDGAMTTVEDLTTQLNPTLDDLSQASSKLPDAVESLTGTVGAIHHFVEGASPVVDKAGPVVADLRPFSVDLRTAAAQLDSAGDNVPAAVSDLVSWQPADRAAGRLPWLDDLGAFVYNTSSSFSLMDANGGMGRAALYVDVTNPTGSLGDVGETPKSRGPGTAEGDRPDPDDSGEDAGDEPPEDVSSDLDPLFNLFGADGGSR